ncbi:hypothetical protein CTI12_AA115240 [Artemisia annua]|uniref:Uncharacterized protein n=1 Tax=Artemisia annua TaxID=35608 RepID=A0A2U1PSQ8_ARTAN|nr:hypothetical protein CTI12_AA115240 [Artemisia annua]
MAGNATFESATAGSAELGFSGSYLNGQRGARSAGTGVGLDRLGNRMFGSALGGGRGGNGSGVGSSVGVGSDEGRALSRCLSLDPIVIGDRVLLCDEFRKVTGIASGNLAEENVKPLPPLADMKDLKRFRSSVEDTRVKARVRANIVDERLRKLDKYCEAVTSKKQKRSELVNNDRAGGYLKMGTQTNNLSQRVEDRPKNILLNKRVRTSVAESRTDCQSNGLQRQHVTMAKDVNIRDDNGGEPDLFEKMRRLAAGGEGWDNKVKRKRSVGTVSTRSIDSDGVPKRPLQKKIVDERGSLPRDAHINRLNTRDDSNRKHQMAPPGSSSPPMAQWVGQRPQKMARARKQNLVSNQDEKLLSFENFSPSEIGATLPSNGSNGSPNFRKVTNSPQKLMVKVDTVKSEIEENVGGECRFMVRGIGNSETDTIAKHKPLINAAAPKPSQRSKTGCKKNGSKPGRRLKKLSDRKAFSSHSSLQNSSSPDCSGASDDDREDLLAAAKYARIARRLACTSAFWKRMESVFAPVSSEDKSFLSQQATLSNEDAVSDPLSSGDGIPFISRRNNTDKMSNGSISLSQRLLSALIVEDDDTDTNEEEDARNTPFPNSFCAPLNKCKSFTSIGGINSSRGFMTNNVCQDLHSEGGNLKGFLNGPQMLEAESDTDVSLGSRWEEASLDDKILLELQSIGLSPEPMVGPISGPSLDDEMENELLQEVDELKTRLHQQEVKKKAYLEKVCKSVENDSGVRDLETLAMDRSVELAYRKVLATKRSSRSGIQKVPKHAAMAFVRRTLARCRKFEKTGISCFNERPYQDILYAPVENEPDSSILSDEAFTTNGPLSNRGKKKELFLDDIGTATIRPSSYLASTSISNGAKGKRSERDTTKSRKPKAKLKAQQKTGQPPASGSRVVNRPTGTTHPTGPTWPSSKVPSQVADRTDSTNLLGDDVDPLDELGVAGPHDLTSFLNFEDQDPEEDFAGGLDIPMDDLTDLF